MIVTWLEGGASRHGVRFWVAGNRRRKSYRLKKWPTGKDRILAIEDIHFSDGRKRVCGGYVTTGDDELCAAFDIKPSGHRLISLDPLHIEASLACTRCPSHGFIRDGRWIDA